MLIIKQLLIMVIVIIKELVLAY